jgi:hypothetical protein
VVKDAIKVLIVCELSFGVGLPSSHPRRPVGLYTELEELGAEDVVEDMLVN